MYLADGTTLSDATQLSYNYNNRGGATDMTWHRASGDVVTTVTRNAARRITQQHTGCLTRNWEFDHLGQVLSTEVIGGTGAGSAPGAVACTTANGALLSEVLNSTLTS